MKYEDRFMSPEARRVYWDGLARLSIARKIEMVSELKETVKALARSVIGAQSPHLSPDEVEQELKRRLSLR